MDSPTSAGPGSEAPDPTGSLCLCEDPNASRRCPVCMQPDDFTD